MSDFFPGYDAYTSTVQAPVSRLIATVPQPVVSPFASGGVNPIDARFAPPVDKNYQRNLTSLTNKYQELSPFIAQLPEPVRNALIQYDSRRVAQGASPLTRDQTYLAAQAASTNTQATPEPDRNPLDIFGNFRSDLGTILKSIPRLPLAMYREVTDLPKFGQQVQEARDAGASPIGALAQAPGIRLLPGAYTVGNLADGGQGVQEAVSHPLMTALDLLPIANRAAAGTRTGRLLTEAAEQAGRRPRPLTGMLTNRAYADPAAPGGFALGRNPVGQAVDTIRTDTRLGQSLDAAFGQTNRDIFRMRGRLETRYKALLQGVADPNNALGVETVERFMPRIDSTFKKHATAHPELLDETPVGEAWRRQAYEDFSRGNVNAYDPAFVQDYRDLVTDIGEEAVKRDVLGQYGGELYPVHVVKRLQAREARVNTTRRLHDARQEYVNPSGTLDVPRMQAMVDDAFSATDHSSRSKSARAVMQVMDAYGIDVDPVRSALATTHRSRANWTGARQAFDDALTTAQQQIAQGGALAPRRTLTDIIQVLDQHGARRDPQVALLRQAVGQGRRNDVTKHLKNLYSRKPPHFDPALWPDLRDDIRSMSRRMEFDAKVGSKATPKRLAQQQKALDDAVAANPPARFDALLADDLRTQVKQSAEQHTSQYLGRAMTADEMADLATAVQERRWQQAFPGMDPDDLKDHLNTLERDVKTTWQTLQANGHDPLFVHKVSPARANTAITGNIGPVPLDPSQGKERALDLSPSVGDLQIALSHQAGELLRQTYTETYAEQIIDAVGKSESSLRQELAPFARQRAATDPTLDFEGHLQEIIRTRYERFNPEQAGFSWGGVRLDKYVQDRPYIPKSVAENLHRITKPPSIIARTLEPFTNVFRYNVIGLSPSIIVNNFFSNAVATMAEQGPGVFRHWAKAKEWLKDPRLIPDEDLKAMIQAENPSHPTLNRDAWLKSRNGQKFAMGNRAANVFMESAAADAVRKGKSALDGIVEKSLMLQRNGDNIYRAMSYMEEYDKLRKAGKSADEAASGAVEMVRRVLVDYTSFTPIERQAIRTIIPFYSFMGHAARFIGRYPLDHPVRASIASKLAAAEKERLGALPDQFLSMMPLFGVGKDGQQVMIPLRPFDPFGDISDMFSISGWLAATNPLIQTALESVGVERGQTDPYPTLRYDPETGRMAPVQRSPFSALVENVVPRASIITTGLGINEQNNAIRRNNPAAANRQLLSMAGIPTPYRSVNVPEEAIRAEMARDRSATQVRNEALRSGDWREALRYPSLRAYYDQVTALNDAQIADLTPDSPQAIADMMRQLIGVG